MERIELGDDDVLVMTGEEKRFLNQSTVRVIEIGNAVASNNATFGIWRESGVKCEVLRTGGGGWTKGTAYIRAVVDFVPDIKGEIIESREEDKSVLDDLREQLNKDVPTH